MHLDFLRSVVERVSGSAGAKSVFGEPVTVHGRTIIPVARFRYGFGGGESRGKASDAEGGGGGGGIVAGPAGFIEITSDRARFVSYLPLRLIAGVGLAGCLAGWWLAKRRG